MMKPRTGFFQLAGLIALALTACAGTSEAPDEPRSIDAADLMKNGRQPIEGIFTGGQPTPSQLAAARDAGVTTVINLRPETEPGQEGELEAVRELGLDYVSIPIAGATGMTEANARELAAALEGARGPVLLHCASGNRVGGLLALKAYYVDGRSPEEAMELGLEAGLTRLEPVVRETLEREEAAARNDPDAG